MFLHDDGGLDSKQREKTMGADTMDMDVEMDKLTSQIETHARISIPSKISFGRRRR